MRIKEESAEELAKLKNEHKKEIGELMIKYDTITGEMEKKHKENLKHMSTDVDKDKMLKDFQEQKGKMACAHKEELKALQKNILWKNIV